jgi:hypothetical protein
VVSCVTLLLVSTHCALEQGTKFVPVTATVNAAVPAVAPIGEMDEMVAAGKVAAEIVNGTALERTPTLETVIEAVPAAAISAAEIAAVICVALTNVVVRGELFHSTTEPLTKFVPVTVKVNPARLQDGVEFDAVVEADTAVTAGGTIMKGRPPVVPPPGPGETTATCAVPMARKSPTGMVAVICVALT